MSMFTHACQCLHTHVNIDTITFDVKADRGRSGKTTIREWTGLEFAKFKGAVENREKMEETGCEIICGAPTTLAVKG